MDGDADKKILDEEQEELKDFWFPKDDNRVNNFSTLTTEEQLQVIEIGYLMRRLGIKEAERLVNGKNKQEKEDLHEYYQKQINEEKEKRHAEERNKKLLRSNMSDEIQNVKRDVKDQQRQIYEDRIIELENKTNILNIQNQKLSEERLTVCSEFHNQIQVLNEKKYTELYEQRKQYEIKLDEIRHKWEVFNTTNDISAKRGTEGENWVYNELVRQFKSAHIEDCHNKGHKGDFTITENDMKGMFESKNYKGNVPKKEITKFRKDIENNADLRYGVLLSLKSGIVNREDFCLEFCGGKPVIYLHIVKKEPFKIKIAYDVCQLILKNMECFDITKEETQQKLKEKVIVVTARHKRLLSKLEDFSNDMKKELEEQWKDFESFIQLINLNQ